MQTGRWLVASLALVLALPGVMSPQLCGSAAARAEAQVLSGLDRYDQYNGVVGDGSGGFVVVGAQDTDRPRESVARLRSFAADGTLRIDRTILPQDAASAALADVIRLGDGDLVATGWVRRAGADGDDCWLIRLSPDGSTRWSTTTADLAHERCYFVTALADGTVLVGGRSEADASGKAAAVGSTWRADVRTGAFGAPIRTACDRPALRCAFQDGVALADGSLALVGWLTDPVRGDDDIWVVRRDAAGRETIRRRIGGAGADLANAVLAGPRDGILVVGYATQPGDDASHGVVMALDAAGEKAWTRQFRVGAAGNDKLLGALSLPDGKVVAVGAASQDAKAPFKGWLVEIGPNGETIREHVVDQPPGGRFTAIAVSNGRLAGVGAARASDGIDSDGWISRLDLPAAEAADVRADATIAGPAASMATPPQQDPQDDRRASTTAAPEATAPANLAATSSACMDEFHDLRAGQQACGLSFDRENRLELNGEAVTGPHLAQPGQPPAATVFPASPSGRYAFIDFMGFTYLIDRQLGKARSVSIGGSGEEPIRWISWTGDEKYVLLAGRDQTPDGGGRIKWLHAMEVGGDAYRAARFPFDGSAVYADALAPPDALDDGFSWTDPRHFRIQMAECRGSASCSQTSFAVDRTTVEFELTDDGLDVVAIENPVKVPSAVRRALHNRQARQAAVARGDACKVLFHSVAPGEEACGIGLDRSGRIMLDRAALADAGQVSYGASVEDFRLVVFPTSPSGRYTVVLTCSIECGEMHLIDRDMRTAREFQASKYGPQRWIAWFEDFGKLLLLNYDDGVNWFQTVDLVDAQERPSSFYFLAAPPADSFERLGPGQFQLDVACRGNNCSEARYPQDLTTARFEVTDGGVRTVSVANPAKISREKLYAFYGLPASTENDLRRLQAMPSPERIRTVFVKQGNMAVQIARATLLGPSSALQVAAVVRVASAGGDQAEADWPLRLTLSDTGGAVAEPGWYVVSGDLRPNRDATAGGGLPSATVTVSHASRCESEGCGSANDLMAMLNAANRLNQSQSRSVR